MNTRQKIDVMLQTIEAEYRYTQGYTGLSSLRPEVKEAMRLVLREDFVPPELQSMAYENSPLPIGNGPVSYTHLTLPTKRIV